MDDNICYENQETPDMSKFRYILSGHHLIQNHMLYQDKVCSLFPSQGHSPAEEKAPFISL